MADVEDKPKRKSVAFSEGQMNGTGEKESGQNHANGEATDPVDEVTDMFKDLAKKKKKKPKKEEAWIVSLNVSHGNTNSW
jgi:translation initiation factor 2 subunit 2